MWGIRSTNELCGEENLQFYSYPYLQHPLLSVLVALLHVQIICDKKEEGIRLYHETGNCCQRLIKECIKLEQVMRRSGPPPRFAFDLSSFSDGRCWTLWISLEQSKKFTTRLIEITLIYICGLDVRLWCCFCCWSLSRLRFLSFFFVS